MNDSTSNITVGGSMLGTALRQLLSSDDIQPGSDPSYQLCKTIYTHHPMGAKIVEMPVKMAQSQSRLITVEDAPEDVRDQFTRVWEEMQADYYIRGTMFIKRIYGAASLAVLDAGKPGEPLDPEKLAAADLAFNILDPLNTAGSLITSQDPNSRNFLKSSGLMVNGVPYHASRTCVVFNEQPIYIDYTGSSFGYVGRSVFQRALFPLKSFIQSMITDDMVTRKAGLLIAMLRGAGSIINRLMEGAAALKRMLLKEGETDNVLSIHTDEKIESLNLQNTDTAMTTARSNIIRNIAVATPMPAQILEDESFGKGFSDGAEDTKNIVRFVNEIRVEMRPLYAFMDRIVMRKAWTQEFFATMQAKYPDVFGGYTFQQCFFQWSNTFKATWPNLIEEPDSEKAKSDKVKVEGIVQVITAVTPMLDPENKANIAEWMQDNLNEMPLLFPVPLTLDLDALAQYVPPEVEALASDEDDEAVGGSKSKKGNLKAVK